MRLRVVLVAGCAALLAATAAAAASGAFGGAQSGSGAAAPSRPPATAKARRTTLTSSQTIQGQLGFGETSAVQAPIAQDGNAVSGGIVTWMPADGDTITRGRPVYKVDEESVPLLYGSVPLYRTLRIGSTGSDVAMLEKNLRALGYTGFTVDDTFDAWTAAAVREWQKESGRPQTGEVEVGDAVVAIGPRRVAMAELAVGNALSGDVLTWTGTERVVSVDLPVQYAELATKRGSATVTLPDNTTVRAVVSDIGTPTSAADSSGPVSPEDSADASTSATATIPVELNVKNARKLGAYQVASVSVEFAAETRANVLAVPVNALFALPRGGYAVEVVTGSTTEYRSVRLGMFGNGMVEVSGAGITEGTIVGVPK